MSAALCRYRGRYPAGNQTPFAEDDGRARAGAAYKMGDELAAAATGSAYLTTTRRTRTDRLDRTD